MLMDWPSAIERGRAGLPGLLMRQELGLGRLVLVGVVGAGWAVVDVDASCACAADVKNVVPAIASTKAAERACVPKC